MSAKRKLIRNILRKEYGNKRLKEAFEAYKAGRISIKRK